MDKEGKVIQVEIMAEDPKQNNVKKVLENYLFMKYRSETISLMLERPIKLCNETIEDETFYKPQGKRVASSRVTNKTLTIVLFNEDVNDQREELFEESSNIQWTMELLENHVASLKPKISGVLKDRFMDTTTTTEEIARRNNVAPRTVYNLCARGFKSLSEIITDEELDRMLGIIGELRG